MKKTKKDIQNNYKEACIDYLNALLDEWEFESYEKCGFWVSDDIGGVFCLNEDTCIDMNNIRYCLDNNIDYGTYVDYLGYAVRCDDYGFDSLNLDSFVKGGPRISDSQFNKLDNLRKALDEAIENIEESLNKKKD